MKTAQGKDYVDRAHDVECLHGRMVDVLGGVRGHGGERGAPPPWGRSRGRTCDGALQVLPRVYRSLDLFNNLERRSHHLPLLLLAHRTDPTPPRAPRKRAGKSRAQRHHAHHRPTLTLEHVGCGWEERRGRGGQTREEQAQ